MLFLIVHNSSDINIFDLLFFCCKATFGRLSKMKVTCSAAKVRAKFDVLGENHGQEILDLQKKLSNEEEVVLEHTRKVVAITDSCSSNEHLCTRQCADDAAKAKCELNQAKKNMHPGFAIAFDNIDGKRERRHMTKDNQEGDPKTLSPGSRTPITDHYGPLRTESADCLRPGPRTTTTGPSTDYPQNRIKNKNKDFTYCLSNRTLMSAKFRALRWENVTDRLTDLGSGPGILLCPFARAVRELVPGLSIGLAE